MVVPRIQEVVEEIALEAKRLAPPTKVWISLADGAVREQHVKIDHQAVPANLRFTLPAYEWDVKHPGHQGPSETRNGSSPARHYDDNHRLSSTQKTYLLYPRDRTGLGYIAVVNCRCEVLEDPEGVRKLIHPHRATAHNKKVTGLVVCEGNHVVQAERGDRYGAGIPESVGVFFMKRGASNVARRRRGSGSGTSNLP